MKLKTKILSRGAEAIIYESNSKVLKDRISKSYRHPSLDTKLRIRRTRAEAKIMQKLQEIIPVPKILELNESKKQITLEKINGEKLSESLSTMKNYKTICKQIGQSLAKVHNFGIIHGDLTTSNLILKNKLVYFIDFGLGFHSDRIEDKATDLHLISEALEAKHSRISEQAFKSILQGYKSSKNYTKILQRLKTIEKRGRYKAQY